MNKIDLDGRVAVITGGAQGIGYAIAERMLASGASVSLWDADSGKLAEAKGALAKAGRVLVEEVAGPEVRERVRFVRDETIANIVANWPKGATAARAARLGLQPDKSFADIIRQYIADCRAGPDAAQSLKGLARERMQ